MVTFFRLKMASSDNVKNPPITTETATEDSTKKSSPSTPTPLVLGN